MRKKWVRILTAGVVLATFGGLGWLLSSQSEPEPVYGGKSLSYWLTANAYSYGNGGESEHAIRAIGTNAIPFLLRRLRLSESPVKDKLFYELHQLSFTKINYVSVDSLKFEAVMGFQSLGLAARGCVPELMAIHENPDLPLARVFIPLVLNDVAPTAPETVPLWLKMLTSTNELDRIIAASFLGRIHAASEQAIPALMKLLDDPFQEVRAEGARALGQYGKSARPAVPLLLKLWKKETQQYQHSLSENAFAGVTNRSSSGSEVAQMAAEALSKIDREAAAKAGISTGPQPGATGFDRGSTFLFDPLHMGVRR